MSNTYGLARKPTEVIQLDKGTQQSVIRSANRITGVSEVARVAMDEMTTNLVTAQQLVAQAMTTSVRLTREVPEAEMVLACFQMLNQQYMQRMINLTNIANDKITQRTQEHDGSYGVYR